MLLNNIISLFDYLMSLIVRVNIQHDITFKKYLYCIMLFANAK